MFGEVAFAAYVPHNYPHDKLEPGLNENAFYDPANFTFPAGTYVCEVEVDRDTGAVSVERFTAVDDFGKIINPMIVEGQVHGGLTQGIGQALTEAAVRRASGQLLTGSLIGLLPAARRATCPVQDRHARDALHAQSARRQRAAAKPAPSARPPR
jgi:CO/xanthine dehydrogenase Mo-binding subunit